MIHELASRILVESQQTRHRHREFATVARAQHHLARRPEMIPAERHYADGRDEEIDIFNDAAL